LFSGGCGIVENCRPVFRTLDALANISKTEGDSKMTSRSALVERQKAPLTTPSDIDRKAVEEITSALNALLADVFALYLKTKNFHWHMSGPHFRDYHLLLDDHGDQLFAMTDDIAERVRKIGGTSIRSIGHIARLQRIPDNDADFVTPEDMLAELHEDEKALTLSMRAVHTLCDDAGDVATASLLENWIDQGQRRSWFLFETTRHSQG
jgi:starvation-inducible DNA-binding protein